MLGSRHALRIATSRRKSFNAMYRVSGPDCGRRNKMRACACVRELEATEFSAGEMRWGAYAQASA